MGIDISSDSLGASEEQYVQEETGPAGSDGGDAEAVMYNSKCRKYVWQIILVHVDVVSDFILSQIKMELMIVNAVMCLTPVHYYSLYNN